MSFDLELVNNDLKIKPNRTISTVSDTPKLRQDIIKIIVIPLGSMKNYPWYGCAVGDNIIGKNLPKNIFDSQINESIKKSLENLQMLQQSQSATQKVTAAEMIKMIVDVHAERDIDDPRKINIVVCVLTNRLTKVDEYFTITQ